MKMERTRNTLPTKNVLVDIWLVAGLTTGLVDAALLGSGLTPDEFALYGLVVDLAPVTAADLVRATGLAPTTLSGILTRCERRGELARVPDPADRRRALLELTPAGMDLYRRLLPGLRDLLTRIDDALDLPTPEVRIHLQALDDALRAVGGVEPRPYRVPTEGSEQPLGYPGPRLSARQQREVLAYVEWLRHRDAAM